MKLLLSTLILIIPFCLLSQTNVIEPELIDKTKVLSATFDYSKSHNSLIYLRCDDGIHGRELWTFDEEQNGLKLLKDINPNGGSQTEILSTDLDNVLLFSAFDGEKSGLWATDGTENGTINLAEINVEFGTDFAFIFIEGTNFVKLDGKIYFLASKPFPFEYEIWVTDGTKEGTKVYYELDSIRSIKRISMNVVNDKILVRLNKINSNTTQLWVITGKKEETKVLAHSNMEYLINGNDYFKVVEDKYFFINDSSDGNIHLWVSDGTDEGTINLITELDSFDVIINKSIVIGNKIFFSIKIDNRIQLWVSDGTKEGTNSLMDNMEDFSLGSMDTDPENKKVIFSVDNGTSLELWVTDGTVNETKRLMSTPNSDSAYFSFSNFRNENKKRLFLPTASKYKGNSLWVTDGTIYGTEKILENVTFSTRFNESVENGDILYFTVENKENIAELWVSDGTKNGTHFVKELLELDDGRNVLFHQQIHKNRAIFSTQDDINKYSYWCTDGTINGTKILDSSFIEKRNNFRAPYNTGILLFSEYNEEFETRIWLSDYTTEGTSMVMPNDAIVGNHISNSRFQMEHNSYIYFFADYYGEGQQLYRIPNTISLVEEEPQNLLTLYPNPAGDFIQIEIDKPMQLSIISSTGAMVKHCGIVTDGNVDVSELLTGVYFVVDEQGNNIAKFVKE